MTIKIIFLSFLSTLLFSCCDRYHKASFAVADLGENRARVLNSYDKQCAVILEKTCYNTKTGTAILCIPVTKGYALKLVKQKGNVLHFESYGFSTSNESDIFYIEVEDLNEIENDKLYVYLIEQKMGTDTRSENESEKKKGTEITGQPFLGCSDDGTGSSVGRCIEYQD